MKNPQKHLLVLVIFIGFNSMAFGQSQLGIKVSGGISRIYGTLKYQNHPPSTVMSSSFSPSYQAGMYYNLPIGKKQAIGAELLYSHVEGGQTNKWDYMDMNRGSDYTYERISYLNLPVYYGITFKKLTLNAGIQISYTLSSSGHYESSWEARELDEHFAYIPMKFNLYHELNDLPIKNFDFGPRAGVMYRLTNKLSIEGMFYHGIQNINQMKSSAEELKIQQMTVGIRYALWTKKDFK